MSLAESVYSKNGVPIRLTDERWVHITEEHSELAGLQSEIMETVANRAAIFAGNQGELLAVREMVAPQLTVVTSTIARSNVAVPVKDARAASVVPSETAAHETTAVRTSSSNGL